VTAPDQTTASPRCWRYTPHAWRLSRLLTPRRLDLFLRARTAARLPGAQARFRAMGIPDDGVRRTLASVRSLAAWPDAWTWTAQRYLGEARRLAAGGNAFEAARARRHAALCYHAAQLLAFDDPKKARALRASATAIFAQALPTLMPDARRVDLPWRNTTLPGYLLLPGTDRPAPLVVLLNGATTAKEETVVWASHLLRHGLAVLALDWPGTGEAINLAVAADCDDLTDGVFELAATNLGLDPGRVALVGFSLGGAVALRGAAFDRRVAACVAVTSPYDARDWLSHANVLLFDQLAGLAGGRDAVGRLAADFALPEVVPRLRCPLLVLGAGRDLVVPPGEALRLCAAAGPLGTLLWYPDGGHGLYDFVSDWTDDVGRWLAVVLDTDQAPIHPSTQVDDAVAVEPNGRAATNGPLPSARRSAV